MDNKIERTENNTAHKGNHHAAHFGELSWMVRADRPNEPYSHPEPVCNYCGSSHPADLLAHLRGGGTVTLATMSRGFPHKLYFDSANPRAAQTYNNYIERGSPMPGEDGWERFDTGMVDPADGSPRYGWRKLAATYDCPAMRTDKFYTEHLCDCTDDELAEISRYLITQIGYVFERNTEGDLMFRTLHSEVPA
jgi:hypothetical protein